MLNSTLKAGRRWLADRKPYSKSQSALIIYLKWVFFKKKKKPQFYYWTTTLYIFYLMFSDNVFTMSRFTCLSYGAISPHSDYIVPIFFWNFQKSTVQPKSNNRCRSRSCLSSPFLACLRHISWTFGKSMNTVFCYLFIFFNWTNLQISPL